MTLFVFSSHQEAEVKSPFDPNQSNGMKVLMAVCAVVGGLAGATVAGIVVKAMFRSTPTNAIIDDALANAADEINRNMPMMVDQFTRIDSTTPLPGKKLMYRYTILGMEEMPGEDEFIEIMRPLMINNYRTSEEMADIRKWGVTLVYRYADENGSEFARFEVTPEDIK